MFTYLTNAELCPARHCMARTEILEVVERAVIARESILTLSSFLRDTAW